MLAAPNRLPQRAALNPLHPLASGHIISVLGNQLTQAPSALSKYGPLLLTASGAPSTVSTLCGQAIHFQNTDYRVPAVNGNDVIPASRVTYAIVRERNTLSLLQAGFGIIPTVNGNRAGGHMPYSDGTVYWDFGGLASPNRLTWSGYSPATWIETWVFVAGKRGSAIYYNGVQQASQGTAITRTVLSGGLVSLNAGNQASLADNEALLLFAAFDAEWTPSQALLFASQPFAYLTPVAPSLALPPAPAAPVTGTAAQTLQHLTQAASGAANLSGSAAQTLQHLSQAASSVSTVSGTAAQALQHLTQAALGAETVTGTAVQTLRHLAQAATSAATVTGSAAQTLQRLTQSAIAVTTVSGSAAQTLKHLTQAASSPGTVTGSAHQTLAHLTMLAIGQSAPPPPPPSPYSPMVYVADFAMAYGLDGGGGSVNPLEDAKRGRKKRGKSYPKYPGFRRI